MTNRRWTCAVLAFAILVVPTFLAFLPTLQNEFVNWDDPGLILNNEHIQSLDWSSLRWMFTSFHMGPYEPLPFLSLAMDFAIWGLDPWGFHLSSLLWHVVNSLLVYGVVRRLLTASFADAVLSPVLLGFCSAFSTLLFSLHPLRVESVAWAAGRLDLVAGCFGLCSVLAYLNRLKWEGDHAKRLWLSLSLFFFVLSLLSKASTLMLPAVLSVLDFYPLRRLSSARWRLSDQAARRVWWEKVPFWICAVLAAVVTVYGRHVSGSLAPLGAYTVLERLGLAGFSFAFHLWKTLVPAYLSPLYELPDEIHLGEPRYLVGTGVTLLITIMLIWQRQKLRAVLAAWIVYLLLLLPASGLAQTGAQLAADRYTYLPCVSFAVLLGGAALKWALAGSGPGRVACVAVLALATSLGLGTLTWRQTMRWHDSQTLWRYALTIDPNSTKALTNLGCAIADEGELDQARTLLEKATEVRPRSHFAHSNLAVILRHLGEPDLAIQHYLEAAKFSPPAFNIAQGLGSLYQEKGDWVQSALWYERALALRKDSSNTLVGLGTVRTALGETDRAVDLLQRAIQIEPNHAIAHNSLAIALRRLGKIDLAKKEFLEACRLDPSSADFCYNLGYLFLDQQDWSSAIEWYERAIAINPQLFKAWNDIGIAQKRQGHVDLAIESYRKALRVMPSSKEPRYNLALALAEQGSDMEAIAEYGRVLELDRTHIAAAHNLAALLVNRRNFSEAERVLTGAVQATNHPALMQRLSWLLATAPSGEVRDGVRALRLAEALVQRLPANSQALDTLAAAYAEVGKFDLAVATASQAVQIAREQENTEVADEIEQRGELYRSGSAYRSP